MGFRTALGGQVYCSAGRRFYAAATIPRNLFGFAESAADERAIDIGLAEEFLGVGGFDRAAVLDLDFIGEVLAETLGEGGAGEGVNFLGLLRRGGEAGADGPDGFVVDDELVEVGFGNAGEGGVELGARTTAKGQVGLSRWSMVSPTQRMSWSFLSARSREEFFVEEFVGFAQNVAACSEWPTRANWTPRSASISVEISPVKAPFFWK